MEGCGGGVVANFRYSLVPPFFLLSFFSPPEAMGLHRVLSSVLSLCSESKLMDVVFVVCKVSSLEGCGLDERDVGYMYF